MIPEVTNVITSDEFEVYFRLLWLFVIIMFFLIAVICYLYLAIRRAQEQETRHFAFSRLVIAGQEAERRRVSCELHDTVLPEVRRFTGTGGEVAEEQTIIHQQGIVTERIREICAELMPPDFSRLSLKDSLAGLCSAFGKRTGIECLPAIEEDLDFSGIQVENQLHLYRMVQEAFTNIEKHANAGRVVLVARRQRQGEVRSEARSAAHSKVQSALICVSDDGPGLPQEGRPSEEGGTGDGLGMRSMRWRAAFLGARLDFISESGNGLMVRFEVPLTPPPPPPISIGLSGDM
jgi:two-component system NarL family sensor kinase